MIILGNAIPLWKWFSCLISNMDPWLRKSPQFNIISWNLEHVRLWFPKAMIHPTEKLAGNHGLDHQDFGW